MSYIPLIEFRILDISVVTSGQMIDILINVTIPDMYLSFKVSQ